MRSYENKQPTKRQTYDSEKVSAHLNEVLVFTGFKTVSTETYGDMGIISVENGKNLTTFSEILMNQFREEAEKGFPFEAKIVQKKKYHTLAAP